MFEHPLIRSNVAPRDGPDEVILDLLFGQEIGRKSPADVLQAMVE